MQTAELLLAACVKCLSKHFSLSQLPADGYTANSNLTVVLIYRPSPAELAYYRYNLLSPILHRIVTAIRSPVSILV